jgi:hypothetical protein
MAEKSMSCKSETMRAKRLSVSQLVVHHCLVAVGTHVQAIPRNSFVSRGVAPMLSPERSKDAKLQRSHIRQADNCISIMRNTPSGVLAIWLFAQTPHTLQMNLTLHQ